MRLGVSRYLPSFPTRRSSDLRLEVLQERGVGARRARPGGRRRREEGDGALRHAQRERSEEHTSELQSRQYLVCRLLLEKNKDLEQKNVLLLEAHIHAGEIHES